MLLLLCPVRVEAQGSGVVTGTVVNEEGRSLVGARVVLRMRWDPTVIAETSTGGNGTFQITEIYPGEYLVEVSYLGYREREIPLLIEMGDSRDLSIELRREPGNLQTTVVSASKKRETLLEAPASVSVLEPERIRQEATTSSVEALRTVPGVDVAQTGIDRREVALRGFNGSALGGPHVLVDHREAATPVLGLNLFSVMPNTALDLERIEVVRGPAAALYGPDAAGGVLHFFTKGPFQAPGTSVALSGGSRSYVNAQFRKAGVLGGTVGYKLTGQWGRADEWPLDVSTPEGAAEGTRYRVYDDPNASELSERNFVVRDVDGDGDPDAQLVREDLYRRYNANGLLTYRFGDETSLSLRGGYASLKSPLQSPIGTLQASDFAHSYGQVRLESADGMAQLTLNRNLGGSDVYRYQTGASVAEEATQFNARLQYGFGLGALDTEVQMGGEADFTSVEASANGVGSEEDDAQMVGTFVQTTTPFASSVDLSLAGRVDYQSVRDDMYVSGRAALVYTPTRNHALRVSYNRAVRAPDPFLLRPAADTGVRLASRPSTTIQTLEAGYKGQFADRLRLDLAGYYEARDNVFVPTETGSYVRAAGIDYVGVDLAGELRANTRFTIFGNTSVVSDDTFEGTSLPGQSPEEVALNAPSFKIRGGFEYGLPRSITIGATAYYVNDFPVRYGPYAGIVDGYTVVDVRLRATIPAIPGLSVNLTAKNVLDNVHREFVGAPPLGRMVIGRVTYQSP